jgi:ABC-type transport system involved in multi-copper enzyme maturation permease subunit
MIGQIARKEFLNNIQSVRFVIGFVLCLVLIPFSIMLGISDYRGRMNQYRIDSAAAEKAIHEVRVYSGLRPEIVLPSEALSIFDRGISGQVGNKIKIWLGDAPFMAAGKTEEGDNPFLASFFSIDFAGVAAIVFSLLALLFSYDAFSREREDGTLKLQMSNSVGRSTLLAGKVLGILGTLLPVLVFGFLMSALFVLFAKDVSFAAVDWARTGLLFLAALAYLAVFVFLGLLISARSRSSVTSLVICLFCWVFFVFIVPNMASNFAESFVPIDSRENLNRALGDLDKKFYEDQAERRKAAGIPDEYNYWNYSGSYDGYKETYGNDRGMFELERRRSAISEPLRIEYADKKWALQKVYLDSLSRQARAAERFALASPAGIFRAAAAAVCGTNLRTYEDNMTRARRYRETFIGYFRNKNVFESYKYLTAAPPESFKSENELFSIRTGGKFKSAADLFAWVEGQKDPGAFFSQIIKSAPGDDGSEFPFLDISDMPRFQGRARTFVSGLNGFPVASGLLLVEIVFLFYLGFVAFIRYDVR